MHHKRRNSCHYFRYKKKKKKSQNPNGVISFQQHWKMHNTCTCQPVQASGYLFKCLLVFFIFFLITVVIWSITPASCNPKIYPFIFPVYQPQGGCNRCCALRKSCIIWMQLHEVLLALIHNRTRVHSSPCTFPLRATLYAYHNTKGCTGEDV